MYTCVCINVEAQGSYQGSSLIALQPYSFEAKSLKPRAHRPSLASQLALKILPPSSKTGVTGSLLSPLGIYVASGDLDPSPLAFPESASYWAIFPTLLDVSFDTVFEHGMSYCCQDFWMTSLWKQCLTTTPTPCLQSGSWFSSDPDPPEFPFNFQLLLTIAQKFDLFFLLLRWFQTSLYFPIFIFPFGHTFHSYFQTVLYWDCKWTFVQYFKSFKDSDTL